MGIVAKGGMKVYTSGVYGELVLRSATIWPSGLLSGIGDMFFVQNSGFPQQHRSVGGAERTVRELKESLSV